MKLELGSQNIINKYTKIMECLNMNNILYCEHEHTFFEILLLMRIIFDMYEHHYMSFEYILINHWKYNDVQHIIHARSYASFKDTMSIRLSNICLGNNIHFLQRIISIDHTYIERVCLSSLSSIFKLKKYIYNYELHNDCPNIKQILRTGPFIASFDEFIFFMDKHKTLRVCEFLHKSLKQNDDVLKYVLRLQYVNVTYVLHIFNISMSNLLSFMIDNKIINNDNLIAFIRNNMHNDYLLKLLKHIKYTKKQNVDIIMINKYNNFEKISHEIKIINTKIFDYCAICMNKFTCYPNENCGDKLIKVTCCNKLMHKICINKLISKATNCQLKCPLCCAKIKLKLNDLLFNGRHWNYELKLFCIV
jgi:hypothetical protein